MDLYDNKSVDVTEDDGQDDKYIKDKQSSEEELLGLINTIVSKEKKYDSESSGDLDPLDILSDLRGDDENTKVMGALVQELIEESRKENELALTQRVPVISEDVIEEIEEKEVDSEELPSIDEDEQAITLEELDKAKEELKTKPKKEKKNKIDDSFIGSTTVFKQEDFDDFEDLKDGGAGKFILKLLVILLIIGFVVGLVILANHFLNLGLF